MTLTSKDSLKNDFVQEVEARSASSVECASVAPQHAKTTTERPQVGRLAPLQWFYNLPIESKHLLVLLLSEFISVLGLVGVSAILPIVGLRSQLLDQAKSELAITQLAYNIKINQMASGFRGQSENAAVIDAAKVAQPTAAQLNRVRTIFGNEIKASQIEYATLVGQDFRIIVNANANRQGEVFNPNNLVSQVFEEPSQIKTTEMVTWAELNKENPPLPPGFKNQDALIRYTMTPVRHPETKQVIGALVSGDIVNYKLPLIAETIQAFGSGYSAVYLAKPSGEFILATSQEKDDFTIRARVALANTDLLTQAVNAKGNVVTERVKLGTHTYATAAKMLPNAAGAPTAVLVRGISETGLHQLLSKRLWVNLVVSSIVIGINVLLLLILGKAIAKAVRNLRESASSFARGDRNARAKVLGNDEVGQLAMTFNQMADSINAAADILAEACLHQAEAEFQQRENERLQQGVINLLLDIEGAQLGDLTVRAKVDESDVGLIADAFNATLGSLQQIVMQVQSAGNSVHSAASDSKAGVQQLSQEATTQANVIAQALNSVAEMGQSIQSVAGSAQNAAARARIALNAAEDGGKTMNQTVGSIENIRTSVAQTTTNVKRLAESSQEISKIVGIISGISEKTNLLAFNASIEAARAGEHGQGFRVVADEVRRLAERITEFAKEIEQLVTTIQQETTDVLQTMEASNTQVVIGTQLVGKTKQTLASLAGISQEIDQLLQSISTSTVSQARQVKMVNQTMQEVAAIANNTSSESEGVSNSVQQMVDVTQELQNSVSRFRVEK